MYFLTQRVINTNNVEHKIKYYQVRTRRQGNPKIFTTLRKGILPEMRL